MKWWTENEFVFWPNSEAGCKKQKEQEQRNTLYESISGSKPTRHPLSFPFLSHTHSVPVTSTQIPHTSAWVSAPPFIRTPLLHTLFSSLHILLSSLSMVSMSRSATRFGHGVGRGKRTMFGGINALHKMFWFSKVRVLLYKPHFMHFNSCLDWVVITRIQDPEVLPSFISVLMLPQADGPGFSFNWTVSRNYSLFRSSLIILSKHASCFPWRPACFLGRCLLWYYGRTILRIIAPSLINNWN